MKNIKNQPNSIKSGESSLAENVALRTQQLRALILSFTFFNKRKNLIDNDQCSSFFIERIRKEFTTDFRR